jgi:peptidoglycan/xylan/chitin deacetylase (PgdA/CDA1 family)
VLPAGAVVKQVAAARDQLEQHTRSPVPSFAYPHGYHTARTRRILVEAGYRTACEVGHRLYHLDRDRLAIPRLMVTPDLTGDALVRLVRTGGSALMPALKDLARPPWRLVRLVAQDALGIRLT